jgi:hypothetical protein
MTAHSEFKPHANYYTKPSRNGGHCYRLLHLVHYLQSDTVRPTVVCNSNTGFMFSGHRPEFCPLNVTFGNWICVHFQTRGGGHLLWCVPGAQWTWLALPKEPNRACDTYCAGPLWSSERAKHFLRDPTGHVAPIVLGPSGPVNVASTS